MASVFQVIREIRKGRSLQIRGYVSGSSVVRSGAGRHTNPQEPRGFQEYLCRDFEKVYKGCKYLFTNPNIK